MNEKSERIWKGAVLSKRLPEGTDEHTGTGILALPPATRPCHNCTCICRVQ